MGWRWKEAPSSTVRDRDRRSLGGFATEDDAKVNAIWNAQLKRVEPGPLCDQLWRSLERAGWELSFE